MRLLRAVLVLVACLHLITPLLAQDGSQSPIEQLAKLARERTTAPAATFDRESFRPDTVFRGKTLLQWLEALRDADMDGTAQPAKKVWLAMGAKAVPFLVEAQALFDWSEVVQSLQPVGVLVEMGNTAVPSLIRLLGSDNTVDAWGALFQVIDRKGGIPWGPAPTAERQQQRTDEFAPLVTQLSKCLGNSDAATRFAALLLLRDIAMMPNVSGNALSGVPVGARRLMDKDPRNEVRGAACELLVVFGLKGVNGGLTHDELKKIAHPNGNTLEWDTTLPPEVGRAVAGGILWHLRREMEKPAAPKSK